MKHLVLTVALLTTCLALPAQAADCYADYKAKRDTPLRLHYGIAELHGTCDATSVVQELSPRLARGGWTLLTVISVFGPDELNERKDNAGRNFLRY